MLIVQCKKTAKKNSGVYVFTTVCYEEKDSREWACAGWRRGETAVGTGKALLGKDPCNIVLMEILHPAQ